MYTYAYFRKNLSMSDNQDVFLKQLCFAFSIGYILSDKWSDMPSSEGLNSRNMSLEFCNYWICSTL